MTIFSFTTTHSRYEDGATVLRKVCSASDFVWSDSPLEILGSVTSITFKDPACLPITDHALTTEEVHSAYVCNVHVSVQVFEFQLLMNSSTAVKYFAHVFPSRLKLFAMICVSWESKTSSIF